MPWARLRVGAEAQRLFLIEPRAPTATAQFRQLVMQGIDDALAGGIAHPFIVQRLRLQRRTKLHGDLFEAWPFLALRQGLEGTLNGDRNNRYGEVFQQ